MRELSSDEIGMISGAEIKQVGKCYPETLGSRLKMIVGVFIGAMERVWGSPPSDDPWR